MTATPGGASHGRRYATFARRVRALVLDGFVLTGALVLVAFLAGSVRFSPPARLTLFTAFVLAVALYEPVSVSRWGRTVGQRMSNLHVVAPTPTGRLPLWKAFLRWLLKVLTGFASFATMGATRRNQALHDLPFHTTVEILDPLRANDRDFVLERPAVETGGLPSAGQRVVVALAYLVAAMVMSGFATASTLSSECLDSSQCSADENRILSLFNTLWLAASIATVMFGWQGRLPGARRRAHFPLPVPSEPALRESPVVVPVVGPPLAAVYVVCGVVALFSITYGALQLEPGRNMALLLGWGPALAVASWLARDSRRTRVFRAYDAGLFFCLTWPLSLPWYIHRSRGRAGWPLALLLYGLALVYPLGYIWGTTLRFLVVSD